jgi:hypothetical protein
MKHTKIFKILFVLFAVVLCFGPVGLAEPVGTAFTYQGRLIDANKAADGLYDFQFKLFDGESSGNKLGPDVNKSEVDVIDGYFTVELDFGSVFDGSERWLDIGVRPGDENDPNVYTTLDPRQKVAPTPYALYSLRVKNISVMDANNTLVGEGAGIYSGGNSNTFAGYWAGSSNTGSYNTFLGYLAGHGNNSANYNIFIGDRAGYYNSAGYCNTFLGHAAGYSNNVGYYNTFTGYLAGYNNVYGHDNTFSGYRAGASNNGGGGNTFIGSYAGQNNTDGGANTFLGTSAGNANTTGNYNVFIGYQAGYSETGSNKLYIDNDGSGALIYGDFSAGRVGIALTDPTEALDVQGTARLRGMGSSTGTEVVADGNGKLWKLSSSRRYKTNIETLDAETDSVLNLRPVRFEYKETGQKDIGLIAEEVEKISPDLVVYDGQDRPDAVKYDRISLYLIGVVKEMKAENELLRQRVDVLEKKINAKEARQ